MNKESEGKINNKGIERAINNISGEMERIVAVTDPEGALKDLLRVERGLALLSEAREILKRADSGLKEIWERARDSTTKKEWYEWDTDDLDADIQSVEVNEDGYITDVCFCMKEQRTDYYKCTLSVELDKELRISIKKGGEEVEKCY